jgi:5-(carboxyamino)imidazole ribonucleotide mutase
MAEVAIIAGSPSDKNLMKKVESLLDEFKVQHESFIASAHRSPGKVKKIVLSSGARVFIAIAGLSAALPGAIASYTLRPVIGVPRDVKLGGLDSLLSIAQMPPGVPVAAVGIDSAKNAALLAVEILALQNRALEEKLRKFREKNR